MFPKWGQQISKNWVAGLITQSACPLTHLIKASWQAQCCCIFPPINAWQNNMSIPQCGLRLSASLVSVMLQLLPELQIHCFVEQPVLSPLVSWIGILMQCWVVLLLFFIGISMKVKIASLILPWHCCSSYLHEHSVQWLWSFACHPRWATNC